MVYYSTTEKAFSERGLAFSFLKKKKERKKTAQSSSAKMIEVANSPPSRDRKRFTGHIQAQI